MSSTQQAPKQIKQYKDFTSVTAIRKFTQQAMAPVIRSLEQQISSMIDQQKQINRKVSKVDDACKSQSLLQQKIQDINKNIDDFKTVQGERKREDDRKFLRLDSVNQKLFLEIHSLKMGIQGQNQIIKQINNKNGKMMEMYKELAATNDKTIKDMQYRYNDFTKDILEMTKNVRQQYQKVLSQIQVIRMTFKTQRGALQEKTRTLELYLSERQSTQQKFEDIYSKIINSVTREDFEGYRKSQKVYIEDLFSEMKHQIQEALPHSLREQLPSIEKKLKQVQKVKKIEKTCTELQLGIDQTVRKITDVSNDFVCKIEQLNKESQDKNSSLQKQFAQKLQQLQQKQFQMTERFQERLQDLKLQIQQEVSGIIQRQTSELQKTIEAQVASNRGGSVKNHVTYDFSARDEDFKKQIEEVRSIKQKVLGRYNKIQEIGQTIDNKIEGYSNKITRIKSDYELFAQNMRKQVSGVIKFRDTFLDRLEDVGKLLSSYTEALFIMTSIFIQKYGEDSTSNNNQAKQPKQSVVFITENDGIIYQSKPQIDKGWIMYRKQKMEIKQFLRSYMYSLITFVDDQFSNLHFLNWKNQKPSAFFKQRVLDNYRTCVKRISQYSQKEKMRRDSCYSISQNQNYFIVDEGQIIINNDPTASTKPFSRTIESKLRFDKVLEEGFQQNEDNRKGYSIKKPKPASGRPSTKQKTTSDKSRYDQMFLSSRSACRSRISQAV